MSNLTALQQAKYAFDHRRTAISRQERLDNIIALAEWGIFSNAQIAHFTGTNPHLVAKFTGKTDRTGGNLPGESLQPIIDIVTARANDQEARGAVARAIEAKASTRMIARLTGLSQSTVMRLSREAA